MDKEVKEQIFNWDLMMEKAKKMTSSGVTIKSVCESLIQFVGKVFNKSFSSEDIAVLYVVMLLITMLCIFSIPISMTLFIWTSFPIFKVMFTSFFIGSASACFATIAYVADEQSK